MEAGGHSHLVISNMKTISNKTYDCQPKPVTTAELLIDSLKFTPQGGFDFATMRARTRAMDAAEKAGAGGTIDLEDADYSVAQEAIKNVRWGRMDKHLISFAEQFGL